MKKQLPHSEAPTRVGVNERSHLLAKFMGLKLLKDTKHFSEGLDPNDSRYETLYCINEGKLNWHSQSVDDLNYNSSWDLLMPVVEECESLGANIIIGRFFCEIKFQHTTKATLYFETRVASGVKIIAVYNAVIQFIEWYNENNK